jgi:hypothetical protein
MSTRSGRSRVFVLAAAASSAAALLALAAPATLAQDNAPFIQHEPRAMARVVYFNDTGVTEYLIEYGKPAWQAGYDAKWAELTKGKRLRLGKDWWTSLNTFCPLTLGEKVELKPGEYFLALECSDKGEWSLVALDPEPLRKQGFDAFGTAQTKGGTKIPLKYEQAKESAAELSIQFVSDAKQTKQQTLEIRFGKHRLTTIVAPKL